jgi:hypothetical protein
MALDFDLKTTEKVFFLRKICCGAGRPRVNVMFFGIFLMKNAHIESKSGFPGNRQF